MRKWCYQHLEAHTPDLTDGTDINPVSGSLLTLSRKPGIHTTKYSAVKSREQNRIYFFSSSNLRGTQLAVQKRGRRTVVGFKTST